MGAEASKQQTDAAVQQPADESRAGTLSAVHFQADEKEANSSTADNAALGADPKPRSSSPGKHPAGIPAVRPKSSSAARLSSGRNSSTNGTAALQQRPATSNGAPHVSAAKQRMLDKAAENKVWMRSNQTKAASMTERRRAKFGEGLGSHTMPHSNLASQMGALLSTEEQTDSPSFEQVYEEKKAEVVSKLSNLISKGSALKLHAEVPKLPLSSPKVQLASNFHKSGWLRQIMASKQQVLESIKARQADGVQTYEPLTQEGVGSEVERSFGSTYETFAGYQGTINHAVEKGLGDDFLKQFFMDEDSEKQLTTYEKWGAIKHAAEQVLQVYCNRSNARVVEAEEWCAPAVLDVKTGVASAYLNHAETALNQGLVALLLIDDGRMVESGPQQTDVTALMTAELWQAMKVVAPHKVPSGQRLERLSVLGRNLLSSVVTVEQRYGPNAPKSLKVVLAFDSEQEHFVVTELQQWNFFGLQPHHVALLPLPRFHGFAQDLQHNTLAHVKGSPRLLLGTGYALYLMASPCEAYHLDATGTKPTCIPGNVMDWLRDHKATWLYTRLMSDIEALRPEASLDLDFLSGAMFSVDREGANMAMEVMHTAMERDVRAYDSVVLGRKTGGNATLCTSRAMRTVHSWQLLKSQANANQGYYVCTQRFAFKISALQRLLTDPSNFHADIQLHDFYAYASLDLGMITTLKDAKCACILGRNAPGPVLSEAVFNRNWLIQAASILEEQDKVDAFRHKAIDLIHIDKVHNTHNITGSVGPTLLKLGSVTTDRSPEPHATSLTSPNGTQFKERKAGLTVVLLLATEHKSLAASTLKLIRPFIRNIVDRLHVVAVLSPSEAHAATGHDTVKQIMDEVVDKELEFNGQLSREVVTRPEAGKLVETVQDVLTKQQAGLLVVPSLKLCGVTDLGSLNASMAFALAKGITSCSVLVVKANTCGRYASPSPSVANTGQARDHMVVMAHLETTAVGPMVEAVTRLLNPGHDVLFLAKSNAFERPGLLSMKTRRVFVQARMAVSTNLKLEERAYAGQAVAEMSKAVESEGIDLLVSSVAGELPLSKDLEEMLKTVKTGLLIWRNKDTGHMHPAAAAPSLVVEQPAPSTGYNYGSRQQQQ